METLDFKPARLHDRVGLLLGATTPADIAVSIAAATAPGCALA